MKKILFRKVKDNTFLGPFIWVPFIDGEKIDITTFIYENVRGIGENKEFLGYIPVIKDNDLMEYKTLYEAKHALVNALNDVT